MSLPEGTAQANLLKPGVPWGGFGRCHGRPEQESAEASGLEACRSLLKTSSQSKIEKIPQPYPSPDPWLVPLFPSRSGSDAPRSTPGASKRQANFALIFLRLFTDFRLENGPSNHQQSFQICLGTRSLPDPCFRDDFITKKTQNPMVRYLKNMVFAWRVLQKSRFPSFRKFCKNQ